MMESVPLPAGLGLLALASTLGGRSPRLWQVCTQAGLALLLVAALQVLGGAEPWSWQADFAIAGLKPRLLLDALGAWFLALLCVVASAGTAYAREYWDDLHHPRSAPRGRIAWSAMVLFIALVLVSANGLHFLIAWELFAVANWFLLTLDKRHPGVRAAGWLYLAASHAGTLALFAYFTLLHLHTGSWDLGPLREARDLAPLFWIALVGFGLKAGVFPLHIWLPSAHANAPSHASALMSGVAIKLGVFGLLRFSGWYPVPAAAPWVLLGLGAVSALCGIAFALAQNDLKRLLAYCSVENIGILFVGLGLALLGARHEAPELGLLALCGALMHVWNHGLFKSLLFLGAGSVLHATGTRDISRLGGLWSRLPATALLFTIGCLAVCALPPLNGFVGEWLIALGLMKAVTTHSQLALGTLPALFCMAAAGALALATFVKASGLVFLGAPRTQRAARAREAGRWILFPMVGLAALCLALGVAPLLLSGPLHTVAGAWNPAWLATGSRAATPDTDPSELLSSLGSLTPVAAGLALLLAACAWWLWRKVKAGPVRRAPTWDCGYAAPTPRMNYTSGSFGGLASGWFAFLLRPACTTRRPRGLFPAEAFQQENTPDTVLDRVIAPLARGVLRLSLLVRRRQHGHLQSYILYLVAGLLALAALSVSGGLR